MFRVLFVAAALAGAGQLAPAPVRAAEPELTFGKEFKGEVSEDLRSVGTLTNAHLATIPVALKEGQGISITATVAGKDRDVRVYLLNPKKMILGSVQDTKTANLKFEEVSATGKYTIVVISTQIGGFTLRATATPEEELDQKALEEKLKRLKKEVEETETKLKALKDKKK